MNKSFDIPFVGLKQGKHHFKFEVGKTFFDDFPFSIIEGGNLIAEVELDKKETINIFLNFDLSLAGFFFLVFLGFFFFGESCIYRGFTFTRGINKYVLRFFRG